MIDILQNLDHIITLIITLLVALESIIVYILPSEKAVKFAFIGNLLNFLKSTKAGLSNKKDENENK